MTDSIGTYTVRPFARSRYSTIDTLTWGRKRHHIPILTEADVTGGRLAIGAHRAETGEGLSFVGWVAGCIGCAVTEHKGIHAMRLGRGRTVVVDDFAKKTMGTVSLTSVGASGATSGWGIPVGIHPLVIAMGNIARRPGVVHERIEVREYLDLTVLFDHDTIDGAPAARFVRQLRKLLETAHGLAPAP